MAPRAAALTFACAVLAAADSHDHIFPFSMPGAKSDVLSYADPKSFNHHCFSFVYAVFNKKQGQADDDTQGFLARAVPLCNGILGEKECAFSLSELWQVRKSKGAKGTKKEWCQGVYEKVTDKKLPTTAAVTTTMESSIVPQVKTTTQSPPKAAHGVVARVKSTTTRFHHIAPRVKSTTTATTTTTTTTTTTSTTTTTTTTTASSMQAVVHSVKAGVDFTKHMRKPVMPLGRDAAPAVFMKSSTTTATTTTSTTTTATTTSTTRKKVKATVNAGVDFLKHIREARAFVARSSTTTTSWPETDAECVCYHREGKRVCHCPEGKTPPPEGRIEGRRFAAAAEAFAFAEPTTTVPVQVEQDASTAGWFGRATSAASHFFGSFMQRI